MTDARAQALDRAVAPLLDELLTPALVLDLDAVEHNLRAMLERAGGPSRWRPHLKTAKQAVVITAMLAAGLRQFKVATLDELDLLLRTAASAPQPSPVDVLVAYPLQRAALRGALRLAADHPSARVHVLADSPDHLRALADWRGDRSVSVPVSVFLDVDLGMGRTGSAPQRWRDEPQLPAGVELAGLHGYDGHHKWDARSQAHEGYDALCLLARAFPGHPGLELLTSGTHSYAHALAHAGLREGLRQGLWRHRVSPGTVVFSDRRSHAAAADLGLRQAAFVASRVISTGPGRLTLDAGSKGVTPDAGARPSCAVLGHPELTPARASEEHLPCAVAPRPSSGDGPPPPALGELLWLIPDHVCTTVNLHREALWVRSDRLVGRGPVASGHRPSAPPTKPPA